MTFLLPYFLSFFFSFIFQKMSVAPICYNIMFTIPSCNHLFFDALRSRCSNLQLDYLDLYLIHLPLCLKPGTYTSLVNEEDILPLDLKSVWEAMEKCQKLGLVKSIGVSNFSGKKLEELLGFAEISPAVNQVCWLIFYNGRYLNLLS